MTAVVVCAVGVEQGIILAIVVSILEVVRRQYQAQDFVLSVSETGQETYGPATAGSQSEPGLIVFRYDAKLFYANANRFVDDIENVIDTAPDQVRWLILDAGSLDRRRLLRRHRARRTPRLPRDSSDHVRDESVPTVD